MPLKATRISSANQYYTPLKVFRAKIDKFDVVSREGQFAKEGQTDVVLTLSGIEVIEADTSFPYKTSTIRLKFSNEPNSTWVKFEDSIAAALGIAPDDCSLDLVVGASVKMSREDKVLLFTKKDGTESRGTVWSIDEVAGATAKNPFDRAMELLEGKTQAQARQTLIGDPTVKLDGSLVNAIISGTFFADKKVTGAFKLVNEVYTKK